MGFNSTMANREVCDLIFVDYLTKKPFLNLDYANVTTAELTGETVYAYGGKGHPKKVAFDGEKGGTLTIETQIQSFKLWEMLSGGTVTNTAKYYVHKELACGAAGEVTITETPVDGTVIVFAGDDDCGTPLTGTLSGTTYTITGASVPADGDKVHVYYMKDVTNVQAINIKATNFPKDFIVYGDTIMKSEDGDILPYRMTVYKAHPQSTMSLSFSNSGDPGTVTITCDMLADADDNIMDLILEDE